jgi:AcrR family transcriptional regulator
MPRTGLTAAELKRKAIEATMDAMRHYGFDKVRLTDIAKELGVSHAALYQHFADKTALLDAVSASWLSELDATLDAIRRKSAKEPTAKLEAWMLALHRAKLEKVLHDPELYKSFDLLAVAEKPYVKQHMATMSAQLTALVEEAIAKRRLKGVEPQQLSQIVWESMMAFHHPKLVAQHVGENREPLLKEVLASVLRGLGLKP